MKKLIIAIITIIIFLFPLSSVLAEEKINKFGIHILDPADLPKAQELVNSSGGDWGWVTVVIRDDDMNHDKWQNFMDECRVRHLIPLVRIATHLEGESWAKPKIEDAQKWAEFLNSLNWPEKDQYVIIFNEPNQAKEWGGEANPQEYAKILNEYLQKFKIKNLKFKILNAGLDLAAPNSKTTIDAFKFMREMNREVPDIFDNLDGWVSHSYPNHGFRGKPWENGKTSIRGYLWELSVLKNTFKIQKSLPVFITETGWPHEMSNVKCQMSNVGKGNKCQQKFYNPQLSSEYIKYAFENVWLKDERIKAVTPFVLNYP
ncbi:MAG: glycosyl hydrolase, partial [Microgenomates group bacterium]